MRLGIVFSISTVKPAQKQTDKDTKAYRAQDEYTRYWNREPGDHDESQRNDGAGLRAGNGNIAEAESLWLEPLAAS
jgi:hypothetical protein